MSEKSNSDADTGVGIEVLKTGRGKKAVKIGDTVTIYYENRLEANGAIVGQVKKGAGCTFESGMESVIQAWNIGIAGMKKGSIRKLTCRPDVAYGATGIAGFIPENATIISEITMIEIEKQK